MNQYQMNEYIKQNKGDPFSMYQNAQYKHDRNRKKTLILDVDDSAAGDTHLGSGGEFNIKLFEPLIIDKHSEIYLDNFLSFNSNICQTIDTSAFCLKINEFNMKSTAASSTNNNHHVHNSLIIPNEHKTVDNNHSVIIHKGKKFNYVCDLNPQTISSISGKITDLAGAPIFHGESIDNVYTYALTGITASKLSGGFPIKAGTPFTITCTKTDLLNVNGSQSGKFLATHLSTSTTLHFSTDTLLGDLDRTKAGDITFNITGDNIVLDHTPASSNADLILIQNPARFIAEFSIIARE